MTTPLDRLRAALADRYRLEHEIGAGGMATVYLANDLKHRRQVAVKVLRAEVAASLGAERFLREVEVAAGLTHPHILPVHDSGEAEGQLYFVMPFVAGESLRHRLDRDGALPIADAIRIARATASALGAAHRRDIVHRDVKPENILLADGEPVLADFGVARAITAAADGRLTSTGIAIGTPIYMAPEQAAADPHLDGRTDLYSLGAVLFDDPGPVPRRTVAGVRWQFPGNDGGVHSPLSERHARASLGRRRDPAGVVGRPERTPLSVAGR